MQTGRFARGGSGLASFVDGQTTDWLHLLWTEVGIKGEK